MIQEETKQIKSGILKDVDSLQIKLNPLERLKVAELIVDNLIKTQTDAVYTYVKNQIREEKERFYETGNYSSLT